MESKIIKILFYALTLLGIIGNLFLIPQIAQKESKQYDMVKDSIYTNKFQIIDTLKHYSKDIKLLKKNSFGFMIEFENYNQFKKHNIKINMFLHGDSSFLVKQNDVATIKLFKQAINENQYFTKEYSVTPSIIFISKDFHTEKIIYQEKLIHKILN